VLELERMQVMSSQSELPVTACFSVEAEADPSVMPRVLEVFAKRGLVPCQWHSSLGRPGGTELVIDIQVAGLAADMVARIAGALRQVVRVQSVLIAEKPLPVP
jgi:acetolactate synthase regulatory subunit